MKLLFWNLYNKEISKHVTTLISERKIDVAIFAEYHSLSIENVNRILENYTFQHSLGGNDKILALYKNDIDFSINREQSRYSLYSAKREGKTIVIAGVHLPANPYATEGDRTSILKELADDVKDLEKETGIDNTIIIGDFNANPFSKEIISKNGLNAVLFKDLINTQEYVIHNNKRLQRFYIPTLLMLSEEIKQYGSYYYSSGSESLYWNAFDQVAVRFKLVDSISHIEYCKYVGGESLITKIGLPNKKISDHLPLYVEVLL